MILYIYIYKIKNVTLLEKVLLKKKTQNTFLFLWKKQNTFN